MYVTVEQQPDAPGQRRVCRPAGAEEREAGAEHVVV